MAVDSFSAEKCAALAARLVKNNTWLSPTFMPEGGLRQSANATPTSPNTCSLR